MRKTGATTRKVDIAIQTLFESGAIAVSRVATDHKFIDFKHTKNIISRAKVLFDGEQTAADHFFNRIIARMEIEHSGQFKVLLNGTFSIIFLKTKTPTTPDNVQDDWIPLVPDNYKLYDTLVRDATVRVLLKFDNGKTVLRSSIELPVGIVTHFKSLI